MSTENTSLTREQLQQVNALVDEAKKELTRSIGAAWKAKQSEITAIAKSAIDEAVAKNQRIVLATVQESADSKTSKKEWVWEVIKLLLPVIATALLGYWIWNWQSDIQQKIDHKTEEIKSDLALVLALKQHLGERKLDVYEDILSQMADVDGKLRAAQRNPEKKSECGPVLLKSRERH